jgi:hypothetical protein
VDIDLRTERGKWALETAQRLIAARLGGAMYQETLNEALGELRATEDSIEKLLYLVDAFALIAETLAVVGTNAVSTVAEEDGRPENEIEEVEAGLTLVRRSPEQLLAFADERLGEILGHRDP